MSFRWSFHLMKRLGRLRYDDLNDTWHDRVMTWKMSSRWFFSLEKQLNRTLFNELNKTWHGRVIIWKMSLRWIFHLIAPLERPRYEGLNETRHDRVMVRNKVIALIFLSDDTTGEISLQLLFWDATCGGFNCVQIWLFGVLTSPVAD